jgi:hypothetical protein
MTFDRYRLQCKQCACYAENVFKTSEQEVIEQMEASAIECTQENECWQKTRCNLFIVQTEK